MNYYETISVRPVDAPFVKAYYRHHHGHRSHRHHEHRCKCFEDCCGIPVAKYKFLESEVQRYKDENKHFRGLVVDLNDKYAQLSDKYTQLSGDNKYYHDENDRLRVDIDRLARDNEHLRCRVVGEDGQLLSLKRRIQVLTREADAKDQLYRDKSLEARGLRHTVKDLDKKLADCKERYDGASITLKIRDREIRERDEVIRQQNATIQRLEHELRHARRDGW
ncbi:hypothetical protein PG995_014338 [Apiospora arundinis]